MRRIFVLALSLSAREVAQYIRQPHSLVQGELSWYLRLPGHWLREHEYLLAVPEVGLLLLVSRFRPSNQSWHQSWHHRRREQLKRQKLLQHVAASVPNDNNYPSSVHNITQHMQGGRARKKTRNKLLPPFLLEDVPPAVLVGPFQSLWFIVSGGAWVRLALDRVTIDRSTE